MIDRPDRQLIIMIIYNENTFLANNSYHKVWTLKRHKIFQSKERGKSIMVSDFVLL